MGFVKQVMLIGSGENSIQTSEAHNISGEFDIDALCGTMSFNLPYLLKDQRNVPEQGIDITQLKRNDTMKLFFGEFDSDPGEVILPSENEASSVGMTKIFDGFIDNIKLAKSKPTITYRIRALGTAGLANDKHVAWQKKEDLGSALVRELLNISGLSSIPFESKIDAVDEIRMVVEGGTNLKELLMSLREKYAVILHQPGDGKLKLFTPFSLAKASSVLAYNFDIGEGNVFDIDYGDVTSHINAVVVLGFPDSIGFAVDPIAVQNNAGNVNYLSFENRNLVGKEACEKVAREKMLEIARNFTVSFRTKFVPTFEIGQPFTLKDNDKFSGNEVFMIKKFTFTIDKGDVSAVITGYTHSLDIVPNNILVSPTGVLDVDFLELQEKQNDILGWNATAFD